MNQKEIIMTTEDENLPATKGDVNWLARSVVNTMANKEDLSRLENKIDSLGDKVESDLKAIKEDILDSQDMIMKKLDKWEAEEAATTVKMDRFQTTLENYHKRLQKIEENNIV